jgi:hypothetical protein
MFLIVSVEEEERQMGWIQLMGIAMARIATKVGRVGLHEQRRLAAADPLGIDHCWCKETSIVKVHQRLLI